MQSTTSFAPFIGLILALAIVAVASLRTVRRSSLFSLQGWDPRLFSADLASRPQGDRQAVVLREIPGLSGLVGCFRAVAATFGSGIGTMRNIFGSIAMPALAVGLCLIALVLTTSPGVALAAEPASRVFSPDTFCLAMAGNLAVQLKEQDDKLAEKSKTLHEIFEKAGTDVDFGAKPVLELVGKKSSQEVVEHVRALNKELDEIGKKRGELLELKKIQDDNDARRNNPANPIPQPGPGGPDNRQKQMRNLGEVVVKSRAWAEYRKSKSPSVSNEEDFGVAELKTLFQTSAGWAPESTRTGLVVEKATRPIQVLDIIPTGPTGQAAIVYMEETTRTHNAAERAEAAAYAEDAFALTQRSSTVRSIGTSIPVTDEQLEDELQAQTYLNQRLIFSCRQRLDSEILVGDGNAPNLTGVNNASGIQTQAKGADPVPDAIYKGLVLVRVTGRAFPSHAVLHPNDWQDIRLLRTADGIYIWGNPSEAGPERIWGIPVVQSDAQTQNTGLVGDFLNFCQLYERRGIEVAVGYVNDDFAKGKRTIRAGLRVGFVVYRGAAFCQVTGI